MWVRRGRRRTWLAREEDPTVSQGGGPHHTSIFIWNFTIKTEGEAIKEGPMYVTCCRQGDSVMVWYMGAVEGSCFRFRS